MNPKYMPTISVIIPSHKPQNYLYECILSIVNQSLSPNLFEVILILNGPKTPYYDNIQNFIRNFRNIRLVYTPQNGVSNARNIGIEESHGEYICFVDDDDVVSYTYLESLLRLASPSTISMSNVYSFKENIIERGQNFFICKKLKNKSKYETASFYECRSFLAFPVAKMIHRQIIGSHRFNSRFKNGEDALFITSLTDNFSHIKFTADDAVYYVRERVGSASRKKLKKKDLIKDSFSLIKAYIEVYLSHPFRYNLLLFLSRIPGVIKNAYILFRNK